MTTALSTHGIRPLPKTAAPFRVVQEKGRQAYLQYEVMTRQTTQAAREVEIAKPNGQVVKEMRLAFVDRDVPVAINLMPTEQIFAPVAALLRQYHDLEARLDGIMKERDEALDEVKKLQANGLSATRGSKAVRGG